MNPLQLAAGEGGDNATDMADVQRRRAGRLVWRRHKTPILGSNAEEVKLNI